MALYRLGSRSSGTATGAACWELRASATDRPRIRELKVSCATAVAAALGLGRPAAIGVTPTSPVLCQPFDPNEPAATASVALAWATGPTIPTNFLDRLSLPATIGAGYVWTFDRGELIVPASGSLILWNLALNPTFDIGVVIEE